MGLTTVQRYCAACDTNEIITSKIVVIYAKRKIIQIEQKNKEITNFGVCN